VRDLRLSGTWQTAYDLRAVDGSCRRIQLVMTFCSARSAHRQIERAPAVSEFMMGFSSGGGEAVAVALDG
jgi:hypothetical protein